jgi:hypothetical protein
MRTAVLFLTLSLSVAVARIAPGQQPGRKDMPQLSIHDPKELSPSTLEELSRDRPLDVIGNPMALKRQQHSQAMQDANRLAQLSKELQQDLDNAGSETLPAGSVKKADEIIKLAKSLKDRMRSY